MVTFSTEKEDCNIKLSLQSRVLSAHIILHLTQTCHPIVLLSDCRYWYFGGSIANGIAGGVGGYYEFGKKWGKGFHLWKITRDFL